jgi:hypothetical protein
MVAENESSHHVMKPIRTLSCRWIMFMVGLGTIIYIDLADALEKPRTLDRPIPPLMDAQSAIIRLVAANRLRQAT